MNPTYLYAFFVSFLIAAFSTPFVKKFALYIGAVDKPEHRKVHSHIMPRLGGLAIVIGAFSGGLILHPKSDFLPNIFAGALIIVTIGILDDKYTLSPKVKLGGQLFAATFVLFTDLTLDTLTLPFWGTINLGISGYIITLIWIIGMTNAVNLMDGLDGLATGLATIALFALMVVSILNQNWFAASICLVLMASSLGFLYFNFYPAKIFIGDTGSLFLGYSVSVISLMTVIDSSIFSNFMVPVIILAVPLIDTLFAIIRRIIKKQSIMAPDKNHLHHSLLRMGNSHRKSVLIIYAFGLGFGLSSIVLKANLLIGFILLIATLIIGVILTAKILGLLKRRPNNVVILHLPFKMVHKEKESV